MIITVNEMYGIANFISAHKKDKVSFKTAFKMNKLANILESDYALFQEKYRELVLKYGDVNEEGFATIKEENMAEYNAAVIELYNTEIEIPDTTFKLEDFETVEITAEELKSLMPILTE